jgi:hypothetical protein
MDSSNKKPHISAESTSSAEPVKECVGCWIDLPISRYGIDVYRKDGRSQYCLECIRSAGVRSTRAKIKNPKPFTLHQSSIQNRDLIRLGFVRGTSSFLAYHVVSGNDYKVEFLLRDGIQLVQLWDVHSNPKKPKMIHEWFDVGFGSAHFEESLVKWFRKERIRLEKDALGRYESRTEVYGFKE